jgi:hypothetical protein
MTDYLNPHKLYPDCPSRRIDNPPGNDSIRSEEKGGRMTYRIVGVTVEINGSEREATAYLAAAFEQHPEYRSGLSRLVVRLDGDWAELEYILRTPFERIRRITGYLQKTGQWNNAKKAELQDRVKHTEER